MAKIPLFVFTKPGSTITQRIMINYKKLNIIFCPRLTDHKVTHFNLVFELIKQLKYEEAITECNKLKSMFPDEVNWNLAHLYMITEDHENYLKYIQILIDQGHINAMLSLGNYYHHIVKKYTDAGNIFLKVMESGSVAAMHQYALLQHTIKNYEIAELYFLKEINTVPHHKLDNFAYFHHEVTKIYTIAKKFYLKSIRVNNSRDAMNGYAMLIENEMPELSRTYLLMAAALGSTAALINLSRFYQLKNNVRKELFYLSWASEKGSTIAKTRFRGYTNIKIWSYRYANKTIKN